MDANTKEVLLSVVALLSPIASAAAYWYFHRNGNDSSQVDKSSQETKKTD